MSTENKADLRRESRLRYAVARQGYALRQDRRSVRYLDQQPGFAIVDPSLNAWVAGMHPFEFCLDLDDVEAWLAE